MSFLSNIGSALTSFGDAARRFILPTPQIPRATSPTTTVSSIQPSLQQAIQNVNQPGLQTLIPRNPPAQPAQTQPAPAQPINQQISYAPPQFDISAPTVPDTRQLAQSQSQAFTGLPSTESFADQLRSTLQGLQGFFPTPQTQQMNPDLIQKQKTLNDVYNQINQITSQSTQDINAIKSQAGELAPIAEQRARIYSQQVQPVLDKLTNQAQQLSRDIQFSQEQDRFVAQQQQNQFENQARIFGMIPEFLKLNQPQSADIKEYQEARSRGLISPNVGYLDYIQQKSAGKRDPLLEQLRLAEISRITQQLGGTPQDAQVLDYYANYLANNGSLPPNTPKNLIGSINQAAKQVPQIPGTIVDANTGFQKKLSAGTSDSITATYDVITNDLQQLKGVFEKTYTGVLPGLLSTVGIRSDLQQQYKDFRTLVLNKILRAYSGKVVSDREFARYNSLLPTSFAGALGIFGRNGGQRIDDLINSTKNELQSYLRTNGLRLSGVDLVTDYSKYEK